MSPEKLRKAINEFRFRLRGGTFIEKTEMAFKSSDEAKDFLIKFLVTECISGINYSDDELMSTYNKVAEMVEWEEKIFSEKLPIHPLKKHTDKELQHVYYMRRGKVCMYKKEKDCA